MEGAGEWGVTTSEEGVSLKNVVDETVVWPHNSVSMLIVTELGTLKG